MGDDTMTDARITGYDGSTYTIGDRVEIHPGTDLWMMGARYGTVVGTSRRIDHTSLRFPSRDGVSYLTSEDRVRVDMDKVSGLRSGPADRFRAI